MQSQAAGVRPTSSCRGVRWRQISVCLRGDGEISFGGSVSFLNLCQFLSDRKQACGRARETCPSLLVEHFEQASLFRSNLGVEFCGFRAPWPRAAWLAQPSPFPLVAAPGRGRTAPSPAGPSGSAYITKLVDILDKGGHLPTLASQCDRANVCHGRKDVLARLLETQ